MAFSGHGLAAFFFRRITHFRVFLTVLIKRKTLPAGVALRGQGLTAARTRFASTFGLLIPEVAVRLTALIVVVEELVVKFAMIRRR